MRSSLALVLALAGCAELPAEEFSSRALAASSAQFTIPEARVIEARYRRLVGTPEGRDYTERALRRRESLRFVEAAVAARGLPSQLEAVAFVESGFRNVPPDPEVYPAAGVWQFIPQTARTYGLRVDETVDERMDPEKSTEAALDLLGDLHERLGSWPAAIAAYNVGEPHLRRVMEAEGTDDVWQLIEREALPTYAADVMAAAAVLED